MTSFTRFLLSATALTALVLPLTSFAQASAIRTGVNTAARQAGLSGACEGTACVVNMIGNVVNVAVSFLGVIILVYFLYAGFLWTTSGGDTTQVGKAQTMIKNAVIGLVIVLTAFALSSFVLEQAGNITNPSTAGTVTPGGAPDRPATPGATPNAPVSPPITPPAPTR